MPGATVWPSPAVLFSGLALLRLNRLNPNSVGVKSSLITERKAMLANKRQHFNLLLAPAHLWGEPGRGRHAHSHPAHRVSHALIYRVSLMLFQLRRMASRDADALWQALYYAIHVPPGEQPPPVEIVHDPTLARYHPRLGDDPDLGVIAEDERGEVIGAAWLRLWCAAERGYGFVDAATPELSIAVWPTRRGQGIGTALLTELFRLADARWPQTSLSVSRDNPARHLYQRFGFVSLDEHASSLRMLRRRP